MGKGKESPQPLVIRTALGVSAGAVIALVICLGILAIAAAGIARGWLAEDWPGIVPDSVGGGCAASGLPAHRRRGTGGPAGRGGGRRPCRSGGTAPAKEKTALRGSASYLHKFFPIPVPCAGR